MIIDTPFLKIKARPLFAGFMMFFASAFGQTYFISIFAGEIRSDFNLSLGEWGLLYSAGTLGSAILMLLAGGLVDRHSVISSTRWVFFAMLFTILFMIINPVFWLLPLIILGLRFCGQGMLHHIPVVFIGREFGLHRGKSISFASMGMSVSEALLPIIFVSIMGFLGWRISWVIVFFLGIVFLLIIEYLLLERQEFGVNENEIESSQTGMLGKNWTRGNSIRHWVFWAVMVPFLVAPCFGTAFFFHQVHLVATKGWDLQIFFSLFPIYTASTLLSLFFSGWLVDKINVTVLLPFFLLPLSLGLILISNATGYELAIFGFVLIGMTQGMNATVSGTFWPEFYGTKYLGSIRSMATAISVFASALSPALTGLIIDFGWSLKNQLVWMGVVGIICSCGLWFTVKFTKGLFLK